jgi:hypothetical protein
VSDTWDSAPLAGNVVKGPATWDSAPLAPSAGATVEQRAAVAASDNGEEAAQALKLGRKTGLNPSLIQTDLPGYAAHAKAQEAKKAVENPAIARYLEGNPIAASVSGDDYDALERSSQAVQVLNQDRFNGSSALSTLSRIAQKAKEGFVKGVGESPGPTGVSNEFIETMQKMGIFTAPGQSPQGLQFLNEATIIPTAAAINTFMRGVGGAVLGTGRGLAQASREAGADNTAGVLGVASPDRLEREFQNLALYAMTANPIRPVAPAAPKMLTTEEFLGRVQAQVDRAAIDDFIRSKAEHGPVLMITKAESAAAGLDNAIEVAKDSKTKARDPQLFAESVAAHDPGELHIDAAKVADLYQKAGKVPAEGDGLLGFVPGLADKIEAAAATGGEVTVKVADYIAHVDPAVHTGLKDVVRLHNDGVTLLEAKEAQEIEPRSDKLYHGSLAEGIEAFTPGSHFGTREAATQRIKDLQETPDESRYIGQVLKANEKPTLYEVDFRPTNTVRLSDHPDWAPIDIARDMKQRGIINDEEFAAIAAKDYDFDPFEYLAAKGYDAIEYINEHENRGSKSYITLKEIRADRTVPLTEQVQIAAIKEKELMEVDPAVFMNMMFKDAKALNITEPEFKAYSDKVARAEQYILDRAVKVNRDKIAQALSAEWKRNEAAVREEVTTSVAERGVFAAEKYLRENKIELGGDNIDAIADDLAPIFGFESGDALRRGLTELETVQAADNKSVRKQREDFIKTETARLMEERHGRLAEKITQEAREIALADHTFDVLADEVRILARASNVTPPLGRTDMVEWAKSRFESSAISDAANLEKLQRAVAKGGRDAEKALLKGDYPEAFQAKQRQFLAAVVAKESLKLQRIIDSTEAKIDRFTSEQVVESIDQGYLEAIREMLASVGVPQIHAPVQPPVALRDLVNESQGQLAVAPWLADAPVKIQDMTVEQFRAFADSLKSMEHVGRAAKKLHNARGEAELQNVIMDIKDELARFPFIEQPEWNLMGPIEKTRSVARRVVGAHLLVERMFDYTDKFNPHGPITEWLDRPLRDSNVKEIQLNEMVSKQIRDMKGLVDSSILDPIPNQLIPDAFAKSGFMKMNRGNLREVMLNMGNWSNLQKLAEGFNVVEADLRRWVDLHATKQDVAYVNAVWKIFDTLKPEADAMQLRDTGVPVDTIPAVPWDVKGGKLNGGYYPVVYHKYNSDIMGHRAAKDPIFDQNYVAATTPKSYTRERTEYKGALDLTGAFLASRIQSQIHDIAFREAVRNANKLISNQEFRTAVAQYWGKETADLLPGWLRNIANSHAMDSDYAQGIARSIAVIRQNVVNTLIGYNPSTVIKHGFTAAIMSAYRVGGKELLVATAELGLRDAAKTAKDLVTRDDVIPDQTYIDSFRDAMDQGERGESVRNFVLQSSAVMRNRSRKIDDSIRGAIDKMNEIGAKGAFTNLREKNMMYGRFAVAFSDQLSAVPTWWAAYKHAFEKGESHADAVFIADKEVSRAHGSSFTGDQPAVTMIPNGVGGEFLKLFTPLYKFYNHFVNNNFQFVWDSKAYLGGRVEPGASAAQLSKYVALVLGTLVIESLAKPALDKDKKGFLHTLILQAVHLFGGGFIGLREFTSGMAHGYGPSSGLVGTFGKGIYETVEDLKKTSGVKAGVAKDAIMHTATTIGFLTGLTTAQMGRTGQFAFNVARGQDRPRTFDQWRQGLRTGKSKARVH